MVLSGLFCIPIPNGAPKKKKATDIHSRPSVSTKLAEAVRFELLSIGINQEFLQKINKFNRIILFINMQQLHVYKFIQGALGRGGISFKK